MKKAGIEFVYAFLGAFMTLIVSTQAFKIDSDVIPDRVLLMEIVISSLVAGMICAIGVVRDRLDTMNGHPPQA